ncbi:MAG: glutathione peroxidase [Saprospiraceae bacterium]|nr:glutathione peroxidase [Saprospiraceae bacterium]
MFLKIIKFSTLMAVLSSPFGRNVEAQRPANAVASSVTLYDFKLNNLNDGSEMNLKKFIGKKVVILNVASECGNTPQYADWQKFYEAKQKDVVVLGIPANEFGGQEPGSSKEISTFCQKNYGVTFPMAEKIAVKGPNKAPLYKWLSDKSLNGWNDKEPTWNFCKYVVNEEGQLTHFFGDKVLPTDPAFLKAIE